MTHITRSLAEKFGPGYEAIIRRAEHVSAADADAHPAFAQRIAGIKAKLEAIEKESAAAASAAKNATEAAQADIAICTPRLSNCQLQLERLAKERSRRCRDYAVGAISGEAFDESERAFEAMRGRVAGLREGLVVLEAAATSVQLRSSDGVVKETLTIELEAARGESSIAIVTHQ